MRKGLFIAGGGKDAGKTTVSIGLISYFKNRYPGKIAFMKPLGQKTSKVNGDGVGQDSYLLKNVLDLDIPLKYSAPFSTGSGAAERFILHSEPKNIQKKIVKAFKHLKSKHKYVIVEGTGHPGVGSVFNLSNAKVASLLKIPVILVIDGGIGSTIDKFHLCMAQFEKEEINISGVVINKILPAKLDKVRNILSVYFEKLGIPVLGYIPFVDTLSRPTLGVIRRDAQIETLYLNKYSNPKKVGGFVYGFGARDEVLNDLKKTPRGVLLVGKGRSDILDSVLASSLSGETEENPAAIILCGKGSVDSHVRSGCRKAEITLLETAVSFPKAVRSLQYKVYKVEPEESDKIEMIKGIIEKNLSMNVIEELMEKQEPEEKITGTGLFKAILKGSVGFLGNIAKKR